MKSIFSTHIPGTFETTLHIVNTLESVVNTYFTPTSLTNPISSVPSVFSSENKHEAHKCA